MPHRYGPEEFFSLPGRKASSPKTGISLPPIRNWPYQNGFTISTWFRIDPVSGSNIEKEKPYLYWFCTSKGIGYRAHFMGSCLVLTYSRQVGKEQQHCVQYEFKPREWYMITISHVYNRWTKSMVNCYINGKLFSQTAIQFYIDSNEVFDKCFLGATPELSNEVTQFSGQLSTIYLFSQSLEASLVDAMFSLGPGYKNQFRHENECSYLQLKKHHLKLLYDGKLTNSIVFMYNATNCDSQLLLQSAPKTQLETATPQPQYFIHNPHALMLNDVNAIKTSTIFTSLLSIGGIQVFYVLFGQLDYKQLDDTIDYSVGSTLLQILCDMIELSHTVQIQMINTKGFLAISYMLEKASRQHINEKMLNSILRLIKFLVQVESSNASILLKQLLDHIIFNPCIWIYCSIDVQTKLYSYLATEFVNDMQVYANIRRISAVIQTLHALKYYYFIANPKSHSDYHTKSQESLRPSIEQIASLRAYMILYIKELVTKENGVQDDELQALLNYLHTVHEDENLIDVLQLVVTLMNEHAPSMIPSFDRKLGMRTIFKLLASSSETIRIKSLKLLGFFLQKSTLKRKADTMSVFNLFSLLSDRLLMNHRSFSMSVYNTLYELLVERTSQQIIEDRHKDPTQEHRIENPQILKVIVSLIRNDTSKSMLIESIKKQFLGDLIILCKDNRENRRIMLQMSVWQEFLIALAYIHPEDDDSIEITNLVFDLFRILLHHAIKYEYGGWRVWIDTLSIIHSRVSKDEYQSKMNRLYVEHDKSTTSDTLQLPPFRTPEFKWSQVHKRLLSDILDEIESEIERWKTKGIKSVLEQINNVESGIFCVNTIHIISQIADVLTNACGGLLPLLASATSTNTSEIEILENTEGVTLKEADAYLDRIMRIIDLLVLANNSNFSELEQEKNMPNGAIIRQTLRLTFTYAVKNCLKSRKRLIQTKNHESFINLPYKYQEFLDQVKLINRRDPIEALIDFHFNNKETNDNSNEDFLLNDIDLYRLRALVYRDVDDTKQCQYIALSTVYFMSVLMVSRYRDIIEDTGLLAASDTTSNASNNTPKLTKSIINKNQTPKNPRRNSDASSLSDDSQSIDQQIDINLSPNGTFSEALDDQQQQEEEETVISSIQVKPDQSTKTQITQIQEKDLPEYPKASGDTSSKASNLSITEKLEKALASVAPILKEIFMDFSFLLSKAIVGSHGQELITSGLSALKQNSSVIELVMLLCSQEWQTSLQKYAGLSFIELVNEGRLLSHASKDHIVRVANEADFILNRLRAEDVKKHAEFEALSAQTALERKEEEFICEHLITAARKRDHFYAIKLRDRILSFISGRQGCWFDPKLQEQTYWKLDGWEDDLRRRRRLVKNPNGSSHLEAVLHSNFEEVRTHVEADALNAKDFGLKTQRVASSLQSDDEIDEKELEQELAGPIHYSTKCKLVSQVCVVNGTLSITANELYFEVDENDSVFKKLDNTLLCYAENLHGKWHFNEIRAIFSRRYLLQNVAIEIFTANRSSVMFAFGERGTVKKVVNILPRVGAGQRYGLPQQRRTSLASPQQLFRSSNMTQKWQRREISNFEYLVYLNTISGRTYNDLNQYPIFPWILNNYDSLTLDLQSPTNYRDLSKPIGALNPSRRQVFVDRYQNWDNHTVPAFHYGTHYSTAAFTLNWLVRVEPFTSIFLNLQNGKFDHADRTFHSISTSWKNCQRDTSDVKELIPEHFYLPEMFLNQNKFNLGVTQEGKCKIDDVELPKWAASAYDYVRINRQALESEFVSCQLHQWIDLIFGYKQKGPEAVRACNVFYYLTYEGAVSLDQIDDAQTREAIECQIKNFGQTPSQLLSEPHPPRSSAMTVSPMMFNQASEDICMMMKFLSNAPIVFVSANTNPSLQNQCVTTISSKHEFSMNKYNQLANQVGSVASQGVYEAAAAQKISTQSPLTSNTQSSQQPPLQQLLPLQMDQLLVFSTGLHKRQLGDNFDEKYPLTNSNFIVTYDNKFILATGFWDKSFRVFSSESAKISQIIYGHFDLVTCIARSEMTQNGNCFMATGARDSIIMLWIWSGAKCCIVNKDLSIPSQDDNPTPGAILNGHTRQINSILVSSELGVVISASELGPILVHTVYGDLLRQFDTNDEKLVNPSLLAMSQDAETICAFYNKSNYLCLYTINGKSLVDFAIDDCILALCMDSDGQFMVMGGEKGVVYVYKTHELSLVYTYPTCDASIRSIALTHDQKYIVAGLSTGCLIVFNINFNVISYRKKSISS